MDQEQRGQRIRLPILAPDERPPGSARPGNLRTELTSFVGRRSELAATRRLMASARLLTLTGPAGVGKTRLALRLAKETHRAFPDGVWVVGLADIQHGDFVAQGVAEVLNLRDDTSDPLVQLADYLRDKRLLLLLDNCEHVVDSCATVIENILWVAPDVRVLATSRQAVGVEGEHVYSVPPLALPPDADHGPETSIADTDALTLFAERGRAADPNFEITAANRSTVAEICRRLDGLPLALELAAVRLRALSEDQILLRLDDALGLLKSRSRTVPPRQQRMEAALEWSYQLCTPDERRLWQLLSVFAGGFTLEAVEQICGEPLGNDILDVLSDLVDKSIVGRSGDGAEPRYHLPEVIRQFGRSKLAKSADEELAFVRHRDHYQRLAERGEREYCGPGDGAWLEQVRAEHANVRAAMEFSLSRPADTRIVLSMATQLYPFWTHTGFLLEGYRWLSRALDSDERPQPERMWGLTACTFVALLLGEVGRAKELLDECRELEQEYGDDRLRAENAFHAGLVAFYSIGLDEAVVMIEQAVDLCTDIEGSPLVAHCLAAVSILSFSAGSPRARTFARTFLNLTEELGCNVLRGLALWMVGLGFWRTKDYRQAEAHIREAVVILARYDDQVFLAAAFEGLSWCAMSRGDAERSAQLHGAADRISLTARMRIAKFITDVVGKDIEARVRRTLGERAWNSAHDAGLRLTPSEAVDLALNRNPAKPARRAANPVSADLTRRETQIAQLVAEGLSNKDIATRLVISVRTAEAHVENILTKLSFRSRTQIASWVKERDTEDAARR